MHTTPIAVPCSLASSLQQAARIESKHLSLYIDQLIARYTPALSRWSVGTAIKYPRVLSVKNGTGRRSLPSEWQQMRLLRSTANRLRKLGYMLAACTGAEQSRLSICRTLQWLSVVDSAARNSEVI